MGGLQAQEPRPPFVALWSRLGGFTGAALRAALSDRRLVRATLMRATLHLVSADDYAALRPALAPAMTAAMRGALKGRDDGLELDAVLPVARAAVDERPRTFDELRALLSAEFPDVNERALGYAVRTQLPLVMVPDEEPWGFPRVASFTAAEAWLGAPLPAAGDPAGVVLRHLAAFGPATAADVQTWSGLRGLGEVLEDLRPRLRALRDEGGRELFDLPDAPRPPEDVPAPPRLLAEFDSLVLAHADRTRVLDDAHRPQVVTKNLRVKATFLWDGRVAGTWSVKRRRSSATLLLAPFARLPRGAAEALGAEAEALLGFTDGDAKPEVQVDAPP